MGRYMGLEKYFGVDEANILGFAFGFRFLRL